MFSSRKLENRWWWGVPGRVALQGDRREGGSFPINVVKKVGLDEKWDREDENLARS
jgi:hypothetical protein